MVNRKISGTRSRMERFKLQKRKWLVFKRGLLRGLTFYDSFAVSWEKFSNCSFDGDYLKIDFVVLNE